MPKKTDGVTIILATLIKTTIEYCAITMEPTNIISIAARAKLGRKAVIKLAVQKENFDGTNN